tara:strand:+ start:1271 stop:1591 length:321 start_codon:yes stop_codon:yes gene_type:complete
VRHLCRAEVTTILTDNSAVIAGLNKRIAELEATIDVMVTKALAKHRPAYDEQQRRIAELESKIRHLNQVIYNTAKVSFEAGACCTNADFHESAKVFAKMMFKRNSE